LTRTFQIYDVDKIGRRETPKLSGSQLAQVARVVGEVQPKYRRYLRFAFAGPLKTFVVFFSVQPVPPDYGPESIVLNDCKSTAHCRAACGSEVKYPANTVATLTMYGCFDREMWFLKREESSTTGCKKG
jgi:hypothetical protein